MKSPPRFWSQKMVIQARSPLFSRPVIQGSMIYTLFTFDLSSWTSDRINIYRIDRFIKYHQFTVFCTL